MPKSPTTKKAATKTRAPRGRAAAKEAPVADKTGGSGATGKRLVVKWDAPRTNRLLDWLDQNAGDRHRLFSDSTATAKEENRRKVTAKGSKNVYHAAIAKAVFDCDIEDAELRSWYLQEPAKFLASVENYISRLRTKYREFNIKLGRTGAGLQCSEVEPGSNIRNLIDELMEEFPYWERLHGYWRTLPNFNPLTVSSEPGQDLEADALELFGRAHSPPWDLEREGDKSTPILAHDGFGAEEQAEMEADPDAEGDDDAAGDDDEDLLVPITPTGHAAVETITTPTFGSSKNGNGAVTSKPTPSTTKKLSPSNRTSGSRSSSSKRVTPLAAFSLDVENDARMSAKLRDKKLDRDISNIAVNKAKIELLAQREAGEIARHRQEHELALQRETASNERQREQNQLRILELQLQLRQGQPAAAAAMSGFAGADGVAPRMPPAMFGDGGFRAQDLYPVNNFNNNIYGGNSFGGNDFGGNGFGGN